MGRPRVFGQELTASRGLRVRGWHRQRALAAHGDAGLPGGAPRPM